MSAPRSAIVVGGGLVGLLTAAELLQRGLRVTVLESGEFARQASWAGGGILSPLAPWQEPEAITKLTALSVPRTQAWVTDIAAGYGRNCEYWVCGMRVDGENAEAEQWLKNQFLRYTICGDSVVLPDVGQLRTPRYGQRMVAWLRANGAQLVAHCAADEVIGSQRVVAGQQHFDADIVCISAGPWTSRIKGAGLPAHAVTPVRGQMLLLSQASDPPKQIERSSDTYLIPRRDGRVLVGSTLEHSGFDAGTTAPARTKLWQAATRMRPSLVGSDIERQWAGLRPESSTGVPLIGQLSTTGVWINTGHFRNGVTLAAGSAKLLADQALGIASPAWADAFDPSQFAARPQARDGDVNVPVNSILSAR